MMLKAALRRFWRAEPTAQQYVSFGLTFVLGIGTLVAAAGWHHTVQTPWGKECKLEWCKPVPEQPFDQLGASLQVAADAARLGEGRGCVTPGAWPKGTLPASMILNREGEVTRVAWTYPAPEGRWVLRLCAR